MTFAEYTKKRKEEKATSDKNGGVQGTATSPSKDEKPKSFAEYTRKKKEEEISNVSFANTKTSSYATERKNAYTKASDGVTKKTTISSNLSETARRKRLEEINAELRQINSSMTAINRGRAYSNNKTLDDMEAKYSQRLKELNEEKKQLERVGAVTASEQNQWSVDDAKKNVARIQSELDAYGSRPSAAVAEEWKQKSSELYNAKEQLKSLEIKQGLYDDISKFGDVVNKDTFGGQTKANYRNAELSREADKAMNRYLNNPTEENKEIAYAYDALSNRYAENNKNALDDENVKASWISKSAAGYMPQFLDQIVPEAIGGAVGALVGTYVGAPNVGAGIGAGIATSAQMYGIMRGSVYRTLLAEGVDEETALKAANDEALISTLIEGGETAVSWMLAGGGKALSAIGKAATKSVAKGTAGAATKAVANRFLTTSAKKASQSALKTGIKAGAAIIGNGITEYGEEFAQGAVSRANREKALATVEKEIGRYGKGNVDLYNRPILKNADGTISTVDSVTFQFDDKFIVLPTIVRDANGNPVRLENDEDIVAHYVKTGEYLGEFDTQEEADAYAVKLHSAQAYYYSENKSTNPNDGLVKGGAKVIGDAIFGGNIEALGELHEQGKEGFKIGLMFGGTSTIVNSTISRFANAKTIDEQNAELDKVRSDDVALTALIEKGKASGEGTVAEKIATEVEAAREKGKVVSRDQVRRLIEANKAYAKTEQTSDKAATPTTPTERQTVPITPEQAAREVVESRKKKPGVTDIETLDALTRDNQPIYADEVMAVSEFGMEGAKVVTEYANTDGTTFSQAVDAVRSAYRDGFTNSEAKSESYTDLWEKSAFNAGRQDRMMQDAAKQKAASKATIYDGAFTENEHTKNYTKAEKKMISIFAKALRMDMEAVDEIIANTAADGTKYYANAKHVDGKMKIASFREATAVIYKMVMHESGHRMSQLAPSEFGVLMDALYARAEKRLGGRAFDTMKGDHDAAGISMTMRGYVEELAVQELETIFGSAREFNKWYAEISGNTQLRTSFERFIDWVLEVIEDIKTALKNAKLSAEERAEAKRELAELEHIKDLYADTIKASESAATELANKKAEGAVAENATTETESKADFSLKNKNLNSNSRIPYSVLQKYITVAKNDYSALNKLESKVKKLKRGTYTNDATGYSADINGDTIRKALNPTHKKFDAFKVEHIRNLNAMLKLPELFKNAVYVDSKNPQKTKNQNKAIKEYHHFVAPIFMDNGEYRALITAREKVNSNTLYVLRVEILPTQKRHTPSAAQQNAGGSQLLSVPSDISIPELVSGVKIYNYDTQKTDTYSGNDIRYSLMDKEYLELAKNPEKNEDIRFSLMKGNIDDAINQSMTMEQAKDMIQRAFVLGGIKEWFDGEYQNGDEWLKGQGASEVALIVDNEYILQQKFLDKIPGVLNGDFYSEDIIEAYANGTLTGKVKENVVKRLDTSKPTSATDTRVFAPKDIKDAQERYKIALERVTNSNRNKVYQARADIIMFAHNRGAAEMLGLTQSELNKKLATWARYTARAREVSMRINNDVALFNRWTGIENSNVLNRASVSETELNNLVNEVKGDSNGWQRSYIMRTMLALDTHIDYSELNFEFVGTPTTTMGKSVNGLYDNSKRKITVKYNAPHTVAHEMGHFLDYQWARDFGLTNSALTDGSGRNIQTDADAKQFLTNFDEFIEKIENSADLRSEYTMGRKEVFARFVAKFVQWVDLVANGSRSYAQEYLSYNDKFTTAQYVEFVRLLQEKSMLDSKKFEGANYSLMRTEINSVDDIKAKYADQTDHLYIYEKKNTISIDNMVVKKEYRNQGIGSKILNDVTGYADRVQKTITLTPTSEFGTKERLKKWYKANGFVENKGRNTDFTISDTMYRLPQGTSFSLMKTNGTSSKDTKALLETIELLKSEFEVTKFAKADQKKLAKMTKDLLKEYSSKADVDETFRAIDELYQYLANGEDGHTAAWDDVYSRAYNIAEEIVKSAVVVDDEMYMTYKSLRDYLRNTPMKFDTRYDSVPSSYENFQDFRRRNYGRLNFRKDGIGIDGIYQELASLYPEFFNADEQITSDAMLERIIDVLDELKPSEINPYSREIKQTASYLANDIIDRFFDIPQAKPTFADKAERRVAEARIQGGKKVEAVRQQKDEKIKKLIEAQRAKTKKQLDKLREQRDKKIKKEQEKRRDAIAKMSESQKAKVLRAQIIRHASDLSKKLVNPTDNQHIPEDLRGVVAKLLESINLESNYTYNPESHSYKKNDEGLPTRRTQAFNELRDLYKTIASSVVVDPDLITEGGLLSDVISLADKRIADMNSTELQKVWDAVRAIEASVNTANKVFSQGKFETILEFAEALREDNEGKKERTEFKGVIGKGKTLTLLNMLTPETYFHYLGGAGESMFRMMRDAQDKHISIMKEVADFARKTLKGVNVNSLEKEVHTVKLGGEDVKLTTAQLMELYVLMKREQAVEHILIGGILPDVTEGKGGKLNTKAEPIRNISMAEITSALSNLTDEQKKVADELQKYVSTVLSEYGNEASMQVYNYEKFLEKNYWTIRTNKQEIASDVGKDTSVTTVANKGMAKGTKPHANTSVRIGSIFDTFASHSSDMATYAAWLGTTEDINRIRNFVFWEDGTRKGTVKGILDTVHGIHGSEYLQKLLTDIAIGVKGADNMNPFDKFIGNYKAASVGANIRVIIQQPTAILRAMDMIGAHYLAAGAVKPLKGWEKALKYAPIAQWKDWGHFDINTGRQMKDVLFDNANWLEKAKQAGMWGASKMDALAWGQLWNAVEAETKAKHKELEVGSEEYYEAVAKRFTEIVDHTQVVDGILQRSGIMRSPDALTKMATSFMGEPTKQYNMAIAAAYDAAHGKGDARKKAVARLGRTALSLAVAGIVNACAQSIVDALRDDDKEKKYWEKWLDAFLGDEDDAWFQKLGNVGDTFNPLNYVPFAKDVASVLSGYDVKRMDVESISKVTNAVTNMYKAVTGTGKYTIAEASAALFAESARLFGLPVANVKRDVKSVVMTMANETDNYLLQYRIEKAMLDINYAGNSKNFMDILFKAYNNDKEAYEHIYKDLLKSGFDSDKIKNGMETRMKKAEGVEKASDLSKRYMTPESEKKYDSSLKRVQSSRAWKSATTSQRKEAEADLYDFLTSDSKDMVKTRAEARALGIDETEYTLWQLAQEMANKDGKDGLSARERAAAVKNLDLPSDTEWDLYLFNNESKGASYARAQGVSADTYADFVEALWKVDKPNKNGKLGTFDQSEETAAINSLKGLSQKERRALWQSANQTSKNNPFR